MSAFTIRAKLIRRYDTRKWSTRKPLGRAYLMAEQPVYGQVSPEGKLVIFLHYRHYFALNQVIRRNSRQFMLNQRQAQLAQWVGKVLEISTPDLQVVSGDASFRRYFRLQRKDGTSLIAVDAPPEHENNRQFCLVDQILQSARLNVPEIISKNFEMGFLLLSDLGNRLYLDELSADTAEQLYGEAIDSLLAMQQLPESQLTGLPPYDDVLLNNEMGLFTEWFLGKHLKLSLGSAQQALIEQTFNQLCRRATGQPQVFVHRDYHSRNLMLCDNKAPGIIDFQDAVVGPISYDLVSLLKDCYIAWPESQVKHWCREYFQESLTRDLNKGSFDAFYQDFEWMGMQRHIKVLGIFCRLYYRDGKAGYLADLALTFDYLVQAASRYDDLAEFHRFLVTTVQPHLEKQS